MIDGESGESVKPIEEIEKGYTLILSNFILSP